MNPNLPVTVRISTGQTIQPDGTPVPTYATPGSITASISGDTLTVASVASGALQIGQTLAGLGVVSNTAITGLLSGNGGIGTYRLNWTQPDVVSEAMTTALNLIAQVQPLTADDLRQLDGLNLSGLRKSIYVSGDINGIVRVRLKGGDLVAINGEIWLVVQQLEGWNVSAGWTKAAILLQDGS